MATLSEKLGLSAEQTEKFRAGIGRDPPRAARTGRTRRHRRVNADAAEEETSTRGLSAPGRCGDRGAHPTVHRSAGAASRASWRAFSRPSRWWPSRRSVTNGAIRRAPPMSGRRRRKGSQPHRLQLGLADESFSEVLRGELKAGDALLRGRAAMAAASARRDRGPAQGAQARDEQPGGGAAATRRTAGGLMPRSHARPI